MPSLHDADPSIRLSRRNFIRIIREAAEKLRARRGEIVGSATAQFAAAEDFEAANSERHERGAKAIPRSSSAQQYFLKNFPETGGGD